MDDERNERVIDEKRRVRVVRRWYATHLAVIVVVVVALLIWNGPPQSLGLALAIVAWLGTFGVASVLLLTGGLLGVYESGINVFTIKAVATVAALGSGFFLYGLGFLTTPVLLAIGVALRLAVVGVQRRLRIRRASPEEIAARYGHHDRENGLLSRERDRAPFAPRMPTTTSISTCEEAPSERPASDRDHGGSTGADTWHRDPC
jgi:hypothetical protein